MRLKMVTYRLELQMPFKGTRVYKQIPLPPGQVNLVIDEDLYLTEQTASAISHILESSLGEVISPANLNLFELGVYHTLEHAHLNMEVSTDPNPAFKYVIYKQPEYFEYK